MLPFGLSLCVRHRGVTDPRTFPIVGVAVRVGFENTRATFRSAAAGHSSWPGLGSRISQILLARLSFFLLFALVKSHGTSRLAQPRRPTLR